MLNQDGAREYVDNFVDLLSSTLRGYRHEGKDFITVGIGCTGGKHRSTAMSEELARRLRADGLPTTVLHRDLGRE